MALTAIGSSATEAPTFSFLPHTARPGVGGANLEVAVTTASQSEASVPSRREKNDRLSRSVSRGLEARKKKCYYHSQFLVLTPGRKTCCSHPTVLDIGSTVFL